MWATFPHHVMIEVKRGYMGTKFCFLSLRRRFRLIVFFLENCGVSPRLAQNTVTAYFDTELSTYVPRFQVQ